MASGERDERWDPSVRRELRQELRSALEDTCKHAEETAQPEELRRRLRHADSLQKKVVAPREAAIDAEHIKVLSEIAREKAQSSRGELVVFEPVVYCEKLITYMGGERGEDGSCSHLDWQKLGTRALAAFKLAPTVNFVYGALEVTPVQARVRRAATAKPRVAAVAETPKELDAFEEEEEATTRGVQHVFRCLREACRTSGEVHYFFFLVDPSSFAHTVENIFHFSFLIKEGRAGMRIGRDGQPYIFLPTNVDAGGQSRKETKSQCIVSMDMKDWQRAIEKFNLTSAAIPHQDRASEAHNTNQYYLQ